MVERTFNFSPGPAALPLPVLEEAQRNMLALPGLGMSFLEVSHRSAWFKNVLETTEANLRQLLAIPDNYRVLFMQGGATLQFSMVPMCLLRGHAGGADYVVTGSWSKKALAEAKKEGSVHIAWNGEASNYTKVPEPGELDLNPQAAYVHFTSNETIQGVEFFEEPAAGEVPLACDQSSDFLSRPIAVDKYGLIYAGAQKNAGPAGVTVVIIRDDLMERIPDGLPIMLDYRTYAKTASSHNTPPVGAIYIVMLVTQWLLNDIGGLAQMAALNQKKAQLLYEAIDQSEGFYRPHAESQCRSLMNVTWRLPDEALEQKFREAAEARGLSELKGHRSVGGLRASIYNAMPIEGVQALRDFMVEFRKQNA